MAGKPQLTEDAAEEQFEQLTEEFIKKLGEVPCSVTVYQDGLRLAVERLETEIDASEQLAEGLSQG